MNIHSLSEVRGQKQSGPQRLDRPQKLGSLNTDEASNYTSTCIDPHTAIASREKDKRPAQPAAGSSFSSPAKERYAVTKILAPGQLAAHQVRRQIDIGTTGDG